MKHQTFPPNFVKTHKRKCPSGLDIVIGLPYNRDTTKVGNNSNHYQTRYSVSERKQMSNATLTVGSQFTTLKSGVVGTIQEIVKNQNGSSRVRLSVNGADRWTTVK